MATPEHPLSRNPHAGKPRPSARTSTPLGTSGRPGTRVWKSPGRRGEWSEPMRHTPRKVRCAHALRGAWPLFPVSPEPYATSIRARFKTTGLYSEEASFGVAGKLDRFL